MAEAARYCTWIAFEGGMSQTLANLLRSAGPDVTQQKWDPRPRGTLRLDRETRRPVLSTDSWKMLYGFLRSGPVLAVSALPVSELGLLHGAIVVLGDEVAKIRIEWMGHDPVEGLRACGPWYRRFVRLSQTDRGPEIASSDAYVRELIDKDPRLFFDPLRVSFRGDDRFAALFVDSALGKRVNGVLAPPWRVDSEAEEGYFSPELVACRKSLNELLAKAYRDSPPMIVSLWRMVDERIFRDFFLNGARLRFIREHGRDLVEISLPGAAGTSLEMALDRQRQAALCEQWSDVQDELRELWTAIRRDMTGVLGRPLRLGAGGGPKRNWSIGPVGPAKRSGPAVGSLKLLMEVAAQTSEESRINKRLLVSNMEAPDQDLTERRFCECFFRCPTEEYEPVWRDATMEVFGGLERAGYLSTAAGVDREPLGRLGGVIDRQGRSAIVSAKSMESPNIERLRLLLPLDTTIRPWRMGLGDRRSALGISPLATRPPIKLGETPLGRGLFALTTPERP